ncbi:MAG: PaaI family thioesterase [Deltaproteobacteria bacterium]|nr:PaaI family thioesterase [Deltaproteobacteria bacterium]MCK5710245.1 PaaI family thioesterase [Deltaproteobacteria bacterium]
MSKQKNLNHKLPEVPVWDLMGIKVVEMGSGQATLTMPFDEKLTNPYGMIHGSGLFALADSAAAVAIKSIAEEGKQFFTIEMKINYLEPVSSGIVEARAKVLREGRIVPAEVDVFCANKLVAKAIATYIIVDKNKKS